MASTSELVQRSLACRTHRRHHIVDDSEIMVDDKIPHESKRGRLSQDTGSRATSHEAPQERTDFDEGARAIARVSRRSETTRTWSMEIFVAAFKACNKLNGVAFIDEVQETPDYAVCCFTGRKDYAWSHIVNHSPAQTLHLQKWCLAVGAFEVPRQWDKKGIQDYLKSKYSIDNLLPVGVQCHGPLEPYRCQLALYPMMDYARRVIFVVERLFASKEEDAAAFDGNLKWKDFMPDNLWQVNYSDFDEHDNELTKYAEFFDTKDNTQRVNIGKYRLYPFSKEGIVQSTYTDSSATSPDETLYSPVDNFQEVDGEIKLTLPAKWKGNRAFPDLNLSCHVVLVFLMATAARKRIFELLARRGVQKYHNFSPELDQLDLLGDYLLALFEYDYISRFRDIPSLPEGVKTVQKGITYRPDVLLRFERPPAKARNIKPRKYPFDIEQIMTGLEKSDLPSAASIQRFFDEQVEEVENSISSQNTTSRGPS